MSKPRFGSALFTSALALATSGCQFFFPLPVEAEIEVTAEGPPQAVRAFGAPFAEGEAFEAQVFIEDVSAGTITLKAGQKCMADGKLALPLEGKGHLGGLLSLLGSGDAATSALIDLDASLPLEAKWDLEVADKRSFVEIDYGAGRYRMHQLREEPGKKRSNLYKRVDLTTELTPHDGHSLLGYLRRWDSPTGTRGFLYVVVGKQLLRVDMEQSGRESLRTGLGEREALRIDGVAQRMIEKTLLPSSRSTPKPFVLWLSADEERIPLRIRVNTDLAELTIDLTKHTKGVQSSADPQPCNDRVDKIALAKARAPRKERRRDPHKDAVATDKAGEKSAEGTPTDRAAAKDPAPRLAPPKGVPPTLLMPFKFPPKKDGADDEPDN